MSMRMNRFRLALVLLLALLLATAGAGPARSTAAPVIDPVSGAAWWPQAKARAAVLFVADPRSGEQLPRQAVSLLRELGFGVMLLDPRAMDLGPARALDRVAQAWSALARHQPGVPRVLAGHGLGATLATLMTDGLDAAQRPQLLWLLAPGRPAPRRWFGGFDAPPDLARPDAALARVDALCIGEIERATRILMVHGGQDREVPSALTQAIANAAPDATVLLIKAAGHDDLLEAADSHRVLTQLLNSWLAAQLRASRLRAAGAGPPG